VNHAPRPNAIGFFNSLLAKANGIAASNISMGSFVVVPKARAKTAAATATSYLYKLFMAASGRRNGSLTRFDAMLHRETLVLRLEFSLEELVMLDIVFIGIALIFFAACLGYTLACERM
jgi:hypothetical protein